jgi:tetratricopeptide (TPR) repeat protein
VTQITACRDAASSTTPPHYFRDLTLGSIVTVVCDRRLEPAGGPAINATVSASSKPNRCREIRVKRKGLSVFLFLLGVALAAHSSESQPVNSTQLMAWLTAGVPSGRLVRIIQERGIANTPGREQIRQFESAGADTNLVHTLKTVRSSRAANSSSSEIRNSDIPDLLVQAAVDARTHRFHEAELSLRNSLASDSKNAALHFALGAMLRQQERWDDAFDEVTRSTELMPDFPENHSSLAYIFYRLDDAPNAIAEARTALSMDPQNAEAYQFLALGLYSSGQYEAAVHAFLESLAHDDKNPDSYYDLGITLHAAGNLTAAIDAYRQAIHLNPGFWQAHSNLAMILHEQNKLDEAIVEYREAKRLAPQDAAVRNNLGNTYCDKGEFDAAIIELRALYRQHPDWEQGHACLARAYMIKKDYGSAVNELQLSVRQNPTSSAEHRILGEALLMDEKLEDGVRELRLAVALSPDSDVAHQALGAALFQQQQFAAAEKEFREALRLNGSPDNHYSLAACLMTMDRYQEALSELEAAARLDPERKLYRARRDELLKLMQETKN